MKRAARTLAAAVATWALSIACRERPNILLIVADDLGYADGETRDRAAQRPDKVKELGDLWQQWNRELPQPLWSPPPDS